MIIRPVDHQRSSDEIREAHVITRREVLRRVAFGSGAVLMPGLLAACVDDRFNPLAPENRDDVPPSHDVRAAQPYVGEIRMFAGNFAPNGWMFCEGQTLPISENEVLFQLVGTTYGGDGEQTFNLPNLASRVPIHMGTGPDGTTYQIGEMAGTEQETLMVQQIPSHTHPLVASSAPGSNTTPVGNVLATTSGGISLYYEGEVGAQMNSQAIIPAGGSQPHENTQPFLCINFIISLFGIFPSQT
jgi:microcystin-dependent protein